LPLHVVVNFLISWHAIKLFFQLVFDGAEAFYWFAKKATEDGGGAEEWTDDHNPGPTLTNQDGVDHLKQKLWPILKKKEGAKLRLRSLNGIILNVESSEIWLPIRTICVIDEAVKSLGAGKVQEHQPKRFPHFSSCINSLN